MTEIKVDLTTEDLAALRLVLAASERSRNNTPAWHRLHELMESIEAQVKPEDPIEALVQEFTHEADSDAAEFWTTVQWRKHHDRFAASLSEVLRIGVGDSHPSAFDLANMADESARLDAVNELEDARAEGFKTGKHYTKAYMLQLLRKKRSEAITAERKDAFDKAIEAVEAIS